MKKAKKMRKQPSKLSKSTVESKRGPVRAREAVFDQSSLADIKPQSRERNGFGSAMPGHPEPKEETSTTERDIVVFYIV